MQAKENAAKVPSFLCSIIQNEESKHFEHAIKESNKN